ncbi:hypothetical protein NMG60_11019252 [Bertholletia excelsa]
MAKTRATEVILPLMLLLSAALVTCEARALLHGLPAMPNKTRRSSHLLLQKLGFDPSKLEMYRRRSLNANIDRASPGGPDAQHHSLPPFN